MGGTEPEGVVEVDAVFGDCGEVGTQVAELFGSGGGAHQFGGAPHVRGAID